MDDADPDVARKLEMLQCVDGDAKKAIDEFREIAKDFEGMTEWEQPLNNAAGIRGNRLTNDNHQKTRSASPVSAIPCQPKQKSP